MPLVQEKPCSLLGVEFSAGGTLVDKETARSKGAWFSVARRKVDMVMEWELRSPLPVLIWMRRGFRRVKLASPSRAERVMPLSGPAMVFVPGDASLRLNFIVEGDASYTVVFFIQSFSTEGSATIPLAGPMLNFRHRQLEQSLVNMSREVARPDNLFDMLAEGWTLQALAHLSREGRDDSSKQPRHIGGLSRSNRSRVEEYIRAHLCEAITLDDLAQVIGSTTRHLNRAFRASFSDTPMQYILALRMEKAIHMLIETRTPITQVAMDCGFSHAQHFSASFSKSVGCSPSEYRRRSL